MPPAGNCRKWTREAPRPQGGALPGKEYVFLYCAPYPAYKAELTGALPVTNFKEQKHEKKQV